MKPYLILFLVLIFGRLLMGAPIVVTHRPSAAATATPSPTPSTEMEGFEGTGAPTGWTDTGTPSADFDSTSSPLTGSQSLLMTDVVSGGKEVRFDFSQEADEFWVAWKASISALPATGTPDLFYIRDSSGNALASVRVATATGNINGRVDAASGGTGTTVAVMSAGSTWRFKVRYKKGTGVNEEFEVWAVADGSGSWGTGRSQTNGTSTVQGGVYGLFNTSANNLDLKIDNVLIKTSDIAISEIN
jgi:hypothetical protein